MDERRKTSRVNISFPVKCTVLPERRSNFCTVTKDLSPSGLKILCEGFIPVGKILKVHVNLLNETLAAKPPVFPNEQKNDAIILRS